MSDPTSPQTIQTLARHLSAVRYEDIDTATVELAKRRVLDALGCALGGARAEGNAALLDLIREWGGRSESTVIGYGGSTTAVHAALVNAIMVRSNDFEVMVFLHDGERRPSHFTASTVPTALAMAEARRIGGREMLTALIAGDDLAARVSMASDWSFFQGFDGIGTVVPWATTAIAGRLLGLDPTQFRHAFGLMINMIGGTVQDYWDGSHAFKLVQGTAAMDGIFAAQLAARGWTGNHDALFSDYGYYRLYAAGHKNPEVVTDRLGELFHGEAAFKVYPSGMPTHGPIDCAVELRERHGIRPEDIEQIRILVPAPYLANFYAKPWSIRVNPHADAIFSYRYTTAAALTHGRLGPEHYTDDAIRDPHVDALIRRTTIDALTGGDADDLNATGLVVRLRDGRELTAERAEFPADPLSHPLDDERIIAKFRRQAEYSGFLGRSAIDELVDRVLTLEDLDDVGAIARLAAAPVERIRS